MLELTLNSPLENKTIRRTVSERELPDRLVEYTELGWIVTFAKRV